MLNWIKTVTPEFLKTAKTIVLQIFIIPPPQKRKEKCFISICKKKNVLNQVFLAPVCADNNHVRTWTVTRFRGMISTQPGSTPLTSFKVLSLDDIDGHGGCSAGSEIGKM